MRTISLFGRRGQLQPEYRSERFDALATYNAEKARGILHSQEWIERMEEEQRIFDLLGQRSQPRDRA